MKYVVAILFDDFETLDVFGPIEVLGRLKGHFAPGFYSQTGGAVSSSHGVEILTKAFSEIPREDYILLVPGGMGTRNLVKDSRFIADLKSLATRAEVILTVCTGAVLFSKTGLLDGRRATSNKRAFQWTSQESPNVDWIKKARWVKDGNIYTSSGVSAGIDMALAFVSDTLGHGTAKQQSIEIEYTWNENADADPFADIYP